MEITHFPGGGRLLGGAWTTIFKRGLHESNPWCNLRLKNNHVRKENSRKIISAPFFRGSGNCKRRECNMKFKMVIEEDRGKYVKVTYTGNVCHNHESYPTKRWVQEWLQKTWQRSRAVSWTRPCKDRLALWASIVVRRCLTFLVSRKSKYENFKFLKDGRESRTVKKECTPFYILKGQNRYKWTSFLQ